MPIFQRMRLVAGLCVVTCLIVSVASVGQAQSIVGHYVARNGITITELFIEEIDNNTMTGYVSDFNSTERALLRATRVTDEHWQGYTQSEEVRREIEIFALTERLDFQATDGVNVVALAFYSADDNPYFKQARADTDPLLPELLSYVPDIAEVRENYANISYNHLWHISEQGALPYTSAVVRSQEDAEATDIRFINYRFERILPYAFFQAPMDELYEGMPGTVGFSFFEIEAGLHAGYYPYAFTIFKTDADTANISKVLMSRNFKEDLIDNVPVWQIHEDDNSNALANPFVSSRIESVRVALFPDIIIDSKDTTAITQSIRAGQKTRTSLAEAPDFRALVYAASTLGEIMQARFLGPNEVTIDFTYESSLSYRVDETNLCVLPPYDLSLFADYIDLDGECRHAWALLYRTQQAAEAAAEEAIKRLELYNNVISEYEVFEELRFESQVIEQDNLYVSLIIVYYDNLESSLDGRRRNSWLYNRWLFSAGRNDFFPAYIAEP
ncbi:MAG: hypothetical protein AAF267_08720 [Deinococcota bacterium]